MRPTKTPFSRHLVTAALAFAFQACSTGLDGVPPNTAGPTSQEQSQNLGFGFDPGVPLTDAINGVAVAGGLVPRAGGAAPDPVVFFAFTSSAAADDGDGEGTPLAREAPADTNGTSDVFLAAIVSSDIETAAFTQGLASVFRHPRCVTCHSMNSVDSLAFQTGDMHPGGNPPVGEGPDTCVGCHTNVEDWRAPDASKDLRDKTTQQLFEMALNPPMGMEPEEHFLEDPRVEWALGSGELPFGNVADDDHDGVAEPEDTDGTAQTIPGGFEGWRERIEAWQAAGFPFSSAESALNDIVLVSAVSTGGTPIAGNGASSVPSITYETNPSYSPADPTSPIGWVYVAFQSNASDLVGNDTNGTTDVYHTRVAVRLDGGAEGAPLDVLNLVLDNSALERISVRDGDGAQADGPSSAPVLAGDRVVFESRATNLIAGFADGNGDEPDVFVRDISEGTTQLVSRTALDPVRGGSDRSGNPDISGDGSAIAFESSATDLVTGDTNGVQDIFFAILDAGAVTEIGRASVATNGLQASGGPSRNPSVTADDAGLSGVQVAFESEKTDIVEELPPMTTTNVFLHDSRTALTLLVNQRIDPNGTTLGMARGGTAPADSRLPQIGPDGSRVMFQTLADNLDLLRPEDLNDAEDVVIVDLSSFSSQGLLLPYRLSVTADGGTGDSGSFAPRFGDFVGGSDEYEVGFAVFETNAANLVNSDNGRHVITFVNERAGTIAAFEPDAEAGAVPFTVSFSDRSSGDPTAWMWSFGDPDSATNTSTAQNPTHTYETPGLYAVSLTAESELGASTLERPDLIRAYGPVEASFEASVVMGTVPFDVEFSDGSSEDPTEWLWDFGDGGTSTDPNPTYTYTTAGTFDVRLTARGIGGEGQLTRPGLITAFDELVPDFEVAFTPASAIAPADATFTDATTGEPTGWSWDFGDGGTSTERNPSYRYESGGAFTVQLTAAGADGMASVSRVVSVYVPVEAAFGASSLTSGPAPLSVNFSNTTVGDAESWQWDFGDGGSSSAQSPTHVYTTPGTYTVTLDASGLGGTDQRVEPAFVTVFEQVIADFVGTPTSGNQPLAVQFTDASDGSPFAWSWDFGDGSTSTAQNPAHTFPNAGKYTVQLTAEGLGGENTETKVDYIDVDGPLVADFDLQPGSSATGINSLSVAFSDISTGSPTSWSWSFGDGGTDTQQNPTHLYASPGVYTVTLTASNAMVSDGETKTGFITVYTGVSASFTPSTSSGNADLTVSFSNTTSGDANSYLWDFGDGGTSTLQSPSYTFTQAGDQVVELTASGNGGTDSATQTISVDMLADFRSALGGNAADTGSETGLSGTTVSFTDTSLGEPTAWSWTFGDGGTSTSANPNHTYANPGSYTVALTASRGASSDAITRSAHVVIIEPSFTVNGSAVPGTSEFKGYVSTTDFDFSDTTSLGLNFASRTWSFSGSTSPAISNFNYTSIGSKTATLTLQDDGGGSDSASATFYIGDRFTTLYQEWVNNASCTGCHYTGTGVATDLTFGPSAGAWFNQATVYSRLSMNATTANCGNTTKRVEPCEPSNSILYQVATSDACVNQIMANANPNMIFWWIRAGAENN